jgi:hypothetical protein
MLTRPFQFVDFASRARCLRQITKFRAAGKLEAPDFGVGEVTKDARVGSGLGNNKYVDRAFTCQVYLYENSPSARMRSAF